MIIIYNIVTSCSFDQKSSNEFIQPFSKRCQVITEDIIFINNFSVVFAGEHSSLNFAC